MDNQNNYNSDSEVFYTYDGQNGSTQSFRRPENGRKNEYGRGFKTGITIGILSALIVCSIAIAVLFIFKINKNQTGNTTSSLGASVVNKINSLVSVIDNNFLFDVDDESLAEGIYKGLVAGLGDKYSSYYSAEDYKKLMQHTDGISFFGINIEYIYDKEKNEFQVMGVEEGGAAQKAGMQAGDIIIKVDDTDVTSKDITDLGPYIKGEEGTPIKVTVLRNGKQLEFEMTRSGVNGQVVFASMSADGIGYIMIDNFEGDTADQFNKSYDQLKEKGMKAVIFDVRNNPGGRLDIVQAILDRLLPEGVLVYTMDKNGKREDFSSDANAVLDVPAVVLINGASASASEIFAGCLQDYEKAYVMGEKSYGKGLVQSILGFKDGSALKLTMRKYYTPNGRDINGVGIVPDEEVALDEERLNNEQYDTQFRAAREYLLNKIK